jgi:protein-disulfide isomerase
MVKLTSPVTISLILSGVAAALSGAALLIAAGMIEIGEAPAPNIEAQTRAYLLDNPEVILDAIGRLEERQQAAEADELKTALRDNAEEIFNSPTSPVMGNPDGDVTIVEFFDYNCPYCRQAMPMLAEAAGADPSLRLVFKVWPILGPGSEDAARLALATARQQKYEAFHKALMAQSGRVDKRAALDVAAGVGLDVERLKRDLNDPEIAAEIARNLALADALRITGTPTFVVGNEIIRGLVDLTTLQRVIADARAKPGE